MMGHPVHPLDVEQQPRPRPRPRPRPHHPLPNDANCDCYNAFLAINPLLVFPASLIIIATIVMLTLLIINSGNDPEFGLNSLSVSNFNISGSEISGIWDVELLAKSPDFLYTNNYPHPNLSIYYQNQQLLLENFLPRIHIPKKTTISYRINALAMATSIQDKAVADAIANDWSHQKVVAFTVTLNAIPSPDNENVLTVNVVCARIKVGFSSNSSSSQGTLLQESSNKHCSNYYV